MNKTFQLRPAAIVLAGMAACAALIGTPAHAGLFDDDEARKAIVELRGRLDQMRQEQAQRQTEYTDQVAIFKRSLLDLNNQIETLRGEIAKVRGQDEQSTQSTKDVARDLAELQRKQKDLMAALDDRLRRLEPQRVNLDGREVTVDPAEKRAYDEAITTLRKGEFARAAEVLSVFQSRYPASPYNGHVQYWLGNALYGKGDVKGAAGVFRALVSGSPDHPRAAEALLALANCQVELKDGKAARKSLEDLVKQYPQSDAAVAGKERLAQLK